MPARDEHPVRLETTLGSQIVDERADVALAAVEQHRFIARDLPRRVDAGDDPLCGGFFVTRRPVDLARQEETGDAMGLERGIELRGLNEIVLDSVARPDHLRRLEPGERSNQFELHRSREAHRVAVQVHFVDVQTLRLQKEVMSIAIGEPHDLVFERRAKPWTNPTNPVEELDSGCGHEQAGPLRSQR